MNILIPMAGAGSRFQKEGYLTPKPLLLIDNEPMVLKAVSSLPEGAQHIFVCLKDHLNRFSFEDAIRKRLKNTTIVPISTFTEGQAQTCLMAKDFINNNHELLISASDNGLIYDKGKFCQSKNGNDCLVFTFRNNSTVESKPEQYGWVNVDKYSNVSNVSVKKPLSMNPIKDHAVVGTFWFRQGSDFVEAAEDMITQNKRVNGEFYVDECINNIITKGLKVGVFEVDYYICWGTPNDLKTYNYWNHFFTEDKLFN